MGGQKARVNFIIAAGWRGEPVRGAGRVGVPRGQRDDNSKCRIPTGTRGHIVRISKSGWRSTEFLRVRFGWGEVSFRPGRTATGFRSAF